MFTGKMTFTSVALQKTLARLISNFISCNYLTRNFSEVGNRCVIYIRSRGNIALLMVALYAQRREIDARRKIPLLN